MVPSPSSVWPCHPFHTVCVHPMQFLYLPKQVLIGIRAQKWDHGEVGCFWDGLERGWERAEAASSWWLEDERQEKPDHLPRPSIWIPKGWDKPTSSLWGNSEKQWQGPQNMITRNMRVPEVFRSCGQPRASPNQSIIFNGSFDIHEMQGLREASHTSQMWLFPNLWKVSHLGQCRCLCIHIVDENATVHFHMLSLVFDPRKICTR